MHSRTNPWFESSDVLPMFPTLVWKSLVRADVRERMNARIFSALDKIRGGTPPLAPGEGWQSHQDLHKLEEFADLVSCVSGMAKSILLFLKVGYDACEITGCWANVLARGASHRMHAHPNNFLSGVYYARTAPGADTINFHDPRVQTGIIRPPVTGLTAENTDQVVVRVSNGTLLMFPAYLQHSVDANASDQERVSVSFNVMFSEFTENLARPLW